MQGVWGLVLGLRAWLIGFVVYAVAYGVLFGDESAPGVAGTGALLGFFLGSVALARSAWPMRITSSRPPVLIAGLRRYTLSTYTGWVGGSSKTGHTTQTTTTTVTHTPSWGEAFPANTQVGTSTRATTEIQDDVVLVGADGTQHNVQVRGANLRVGDGQLVSAVWAIPAGRQRGPYVFFRNHTTNDNAIPFVQVWKLSAGRGVGWFVLAMWLGGILLMGTGHGTAGLLWFFPLPMTYIVLNYLQAYRFRGFGSARLVRYLDDVAATFPTGDEPAPAPAAAPPPPPAPPSAPAPDPGAPPGWLPDPFGRHEHRYWDGARWTEHVGNGGQAAVDAPRPAEATPTDSSAV